ncbi:MAG: hypothetical protein ACYTFW_20210 [Planctomycetota bacterium]|jgi:hypothetical protein
MSGEISFWLCLEDQMALWAVVVGDVYIGVHTAQASENEDEPYKHCQNASEGPEEEQEDHLGESDGHQDKRDNTVAATGIGRTTGGTLRVMFLLKLLLEFLFRLLKFGVVHVVCHLLSPEISHISL